MAHPLEVMNKLILGRYRTKMADKFRQIHGFQYFEVTCMLFQNMCLSLLHAIVKVPLEKNQYLSDIIISCSF